MPLTDTIAILLRTAAQQPGQIQKRNLARGLQIRVKIVGDTTSFGISRADTIPSLQEWRTCLNALPYPMRIKNPASGISKDGWYTLYAEWPTPSQQEQALS